MRKLVLALLFSASSAWAFPPMQISLLGGSEIPIAVQVVSQGRLLKAGNCTFTPTYIVSPATAPAPTAFSWSTNSGNLSGATTSAPSLAVIANSTATVSLTLTIGGVKYVATPGAYRCTTTQ